MSKNFCVYILSNKKDGVLYTGVTSNLVKRLYEHKSRAIEGFSTRYNLGMLVYYEMYDDAEAAIQREKRIKKWNRAWKIELIEKENPNWDDLSAKII